MSTTLACSLWSSIRNESHGSHLNADAYIEEIASVIQSVADFHIAETAAAKEQIACRDVQIRELCKVIKEMKTALSDVQEIGRLPEELASRIDALIKMPLPNRRVR